LHSKGQLLVDLRNALKAEEWETVQAVLKRAAGLSFQSDEITSANEEVQ
jgi:hypothetical protein